MATLILVGVALVAAAIPLSAARSSTPALAAQLVGMALVAGSAIGILATGDAVGAAFDSSIAPRFGVDGLSAFFLIIVAVVALPAVLYGRDGLADSPVRRALTAVTAGFLLSLIGVVAARDVTSFLGFWELMTLIPATAILIARRDAAVRRVVFIYLAITHLGGAGVWVAMLTLAHHGILGGSPATAFPQTLVIVAALIGFGTKAGVMPLHVWLPRAHPVAPSHVSALMSAVMVKVALYGLVRVLFDWAAPVPRWVGLLLLGLGAVSAVAGVLYALVQRELKRLLAFSTVENVGIVVAALGASIVLFAEGRPLWGTIAFAAALLHMLNHAAFKALLFLAAGAFGHAAGTLALDRMGGLLRRMPWTGWAFIVGCAAIAGVPPLNGFVSEWLTLQSMLHVGYSSPAGVSVAGALALVGLAATAALAVYCFVKVIGLVLLGAPRTERAAEAVEQPWATRVAVGSLAVLCAGLGAVPGLILPALAELAPGDVTLGSQPGLPLPDTGHLPTVGLIVALLLVFGVMRRATAATHRSPETPVWTCGQPVEAPLAWTSAGFTKPLRLVLEAVYRPERELEISETSAGVERIRYRAEVPHLFDDLLYGPVQRRALRGAAFARRLQSGSLRAYVLYLLALILALLTVVRFGGLA